MKKNILKKTYLKLLKLPKNLKVALTISIACFLVVVVVFTNEALAFYQYNFHIKEADKLTKESRYFQANELLLKANKRISFSILTKAVKSAELAQITNKNHDLAQSNSVKPDEANIEEYERPNPSFTPTPTLTPTVTPSPNPTTIPNANKEENNNLDWINDSDTIMGEGQASSHGQVSKIAVRFKVSKKNYQKIYFHISGICEGVANGGVSNAITNSYDHVITSGEAVGDCMYQGKNYKVKAHFSGKIYLNTGRAEGYWYNKDNGQGLSTGWVKGDWHFNFDPQRLNF